MPCLNILPPAFMLKRSLLAENPLRVCLPALPASLAWHNMRQYLFLLPVLPIFSTSRLQVTVICSDLRFAAFLKTADDRVTWPELRLEILWIKRWMP